MRGQTELAPIVADRNQGTLPSVPVFSSRMVLPSQHCRRFFRRTAFIPGTNTSGFHFAAFGDNSVDASITTFGLLGKVMLCATLFRFNGNR